MNELIAYAKSRTAQKLGRDILLFGIPAVLLWVADASNTDVIVRWTQVSPELAAKAAAYAASLLVAYRLVRGYLGRGPI